MAGSHFSNMNILALDLATKTGFAKQVQGIPLSIGTRDFTQKKGRKTMPDDPHPFTQYLQWLKAQTFDQFNRVVFERPGFFKSLDARNSSVGFRAITIMVCDVYGVPWSEVSPGSVKKFATGSGNANKKAMLKAAQQMSGGMLDGMDHNAADAYLLLRYTLNEAQS